MMIHGKNNIGGKLSAQGIGTFRIRSPLDQGELPGGFHRTSRMETGQAMEVAAEAAQEYSRSTDSQRARLLEGIRDLLTLHSGDLKERCRKETALSETRLQGELQRTCHQLGQFAQLIREGSWVRATLRSGTLPKPFHIRKMLQALGPVVVFTAGNFPFAFSTAGGDTAAALAAGNPVVIKSHPYHAGTNELVGELIAEAIRNCGLPGGIFSWLNSDDYDTGLALVTHPLTRAVTFTGSFHGGMALYRAAAGRPDPIPVFAEMGSLNPVLLLPAALRFSREHWVKALAQSITLSQGQFCTKPGLLIGLEGPALDLFGQELSSTLEALDPAPMLHLQIESRYQQALEEIDGAAGIRSSKSYASGSAGLLRVDAETFLAAPRLKEEVFGPFSILVACRNQQEIARILEVLGGQLTATILGREEELSSFGACLDLLPKLAGRVIFNGVPTGVEVCDAMQHGGPFPASTDSRFSSVGTDSIYRFLRPVCYQDCPGSLLPDALQDQNPLGIERRINGILSRGPFPFPEDKNSSDA